MTSEWNICDQLKALAFRRPLFDVTRIQNFGEAGLGRTATMT